jgi:hypothetical protein
MAACPGASASLPPLQLGVDICGCPSCRSCSARFFGVGFPPLAGVHRLEELIAAVPVLHLVTIRHNVTLVALTEKMAALYGDLASRLPLLASASLQPSVPSTPPAP